MTSAQYERAVRPVDPANPADPADPAEPTGSARVVSDEPCASCETREARPLYAIEGIASRLVVCERCGTGRLDPMPSESEIAAFYPDSYYGDPGAAKFQPWIELFVRLIGARHVRFFLRGLAPGARILDVGCGRGVLLSEIARRGFEAHGVEISESAARGADARAQIRIAPHLAAAAYPDAFFDEIILWHVLEHLRDPRATLLEAARILKPGGTIVVAVPNFSSAQARWAGPAWFHLDLPRHLHHFPLAGLRRILEETGFRCASSHHFSLRQNPFGWIQSASNRDASLPRNGLYTLLHQRAQGGAAIADPALRRRLLARGALFAAPALALGFAEAALRSGATVHVVARRAG